MAAGDSTTEAPPTYINRYPLTRPPLSPSGPLLETIERWYYVDQFNLQAGYEDLLYIEYVLNWLAFHDQRNDFSEYEGNPDGDLLTCLAELYMAEWSFRTLLEQTIQPWDLEVIFDLVETARSMETQPYFKGNLPSGDHVHKS
ncbi:uncharacterized protein N7496_007803 [Penicillium cataractarum]|uniref:Uncharacterized protein n=1 Tax=Penicillium cataractarum TaxID=2100454 RepID=A0A9W9RX67_9EURO|nr:uncharacterized protein N7496_007803 [Penicillium cataractarum]KAJ5368043.1 hypothetical protein N7496_007803 [Penicillium cataractarum]